MIYYLFDVFSKILSVGKIQTEYCVQLIVSAFLDLLEMFLFTWGDDDGAIDEDGVGQVLGHRNAAGVAELNETASTNGKENSTFSLWLNL